ncbi:MAG TPA: amino acid ABC transporter permease [Casimicrobiaceae bacterium]|nr:amino acid ABC transporter permease [Casimicrobiaceae bacterium]
MSRDFDWSAFLFLLGALRWTVVLSIIAFVGGGIGGLLLALARTSPYRTLRWIATGYIGLLQGTPVLMQLFLAYYGLAVLTGLRIDPWPAVTLAFTLYAAAFLGEIWRGAIQAIPRQQWEAAAAIPLSPFAQLRHVILPQAMRIAIPPTVGFLVQLIKGTSIASIIGFVELTRAGQLIVNVTFQPMIVYPIIALLYFALCWPLSLLALRLERRIDAALGIGQPA